MRSFHSVVLARVLATVSLLVLASCHGSRDDKDLAGAKQPLGSECRRVELNASRTYSPSRWTDADQAVSPALTFALPASIAVTSGHAAQQWSELQMQIWPSGAWVSCRYDGTTGGVSYDFTSCSSGATPGTTINATRFKLHVQKGDHKDPAGETVIRLVLEDVACASCDDHNPCTFDERTSTGCTHTVLAGADCSNGNPCDGAETCLETIKEIRGGSITPARCPFARIRRPLHRSRAIETPRFGAIVSTHLRESTLQTSSAGHSRPVQAVQAAGCSRRPSRKQGWSPVSNW